MNAEQFIALSPIMTIAITVLVLMLTIALRRHFALACFMSGIGIVASLLTTFIARNRAPVQVTQLIRIDAYGLFYIVLLLMAALAVIAFCYDYFKERDGENEELLLLILMALLGGSVLVTSSHFASFFIGLETLSVSLFVLSGFTFERSRSLEAAIKYLVLSGVSSAFLLMGMALIYAQCGMLEFTDIGHYIAGRRASNVIILSGLLFMIAALGFKLSLVPFHLWTPDVYEGAPAPVTAFIATVSKGAVFALLLRYFISSEGYSYSPIMTILTLIAVLTVLGGNLLALLQGNIKRLLAYSSIAHIGYLLIALIAGQSIAPNLVKESVSFYLPAYFFTTLGVFGTVSILSTSEKEATDFSYYQGLFWRRPWLAGMFTLMLLSLAGIPLTAGFIGKFYIFTTGVEARLWGLLLTLIVGSGLGIYYYLRIIVSMSMNMELSINEDDRSDCKWISYLALCVLTLFVVWFGINPSYLISLIQGL